jgi:hypothetical protein
MLTTDDLLKLTKLLYPNGRAFKMPYGGTFEGLQNGINQSLFRAFNDSDRILDSILPDNPNFTLQDARDWYRRLGIYDSGSVSFDDMKAAILQKWNCHGGERYRQSGLYIETQLQMAGFNVQVKPNRFWNGSEFVAVPPEYILGYSVMDAVFGEVESGMSEYGFLMSDTGVTVIANYIEESKDLEFAFADNFIFSFFVADVSGLDVFASIPLSRKTEFRQLLLKLKAQHSAGFLFVNYV